MHFKLLLLLSIIIVSYNVKHFTEQCLHSVKKAINGINTEVIVVDNNSTDKTVGYLQEIFPWVCFIANPANTGYAAANNLGYQQAKGDYILFLNPDTLLSEDCLQASIEILKNNDRIGALGIHMIDGTGHFLPESKRGFPSVPASFFKLSGLTYLFPRSHRISHYYLGWLPEKENNEVEVLAGAYMMIKKQILDNIGGFDEQFFMYGEDIDLSYRIRQAGFKNYYLGEKTIVHFKGESTRRDIRYTRLFYKAMGLFVKKHYGRGPSAFTLLLQLAIVTRGLASFLRQLLFGSEQKVRKGRMINALMAGDPFDTKSAAEILISQPATRRKISGSMDLKAIANPGKEIDEIVFCPGILSYSSIFNMMQQIAQKRCIFRFSASGSKSIVSSMSKRSSGEVLVR